MTNRHCPLRWFAGAAMLLSTACSDNTSDVSVGDVSVSAVGTPTSAQASTAETNSASTTTGGTSGATPGGPSEATPGVTSGAPLGDPVVTLNKIDGFTKPVLVSYRPSDGALFVAEQGGLILRLNDDGPGATALDMTDLTSAGGERGLLGLAFSADGSLAYVDYTNNDGNTRVDEYSVGADGTFDPASRREVLGFDQPYANHNGGDLQFGPDGMLYISTGDGGSGGDPDRRALDLSEWLGKILRIDPHDSADAAYTVPSDNPFVDTDGARPEIWAYGLRNPWRFSFDRSTGDLWIADVGQNQWEEVDAAWAADGGGRGANFGWSAMEGNHPFNRDQSADGAIPPIHEYEHVGNDCSISGSALYRGTKIPALVGYYVFADYCSGQVRALQIADRAVAKRVPLGTVPAVTSINEGPDGELFVVSGSGSVYTVNPG